MPARSVLLLVASLAVFAVPARADAPPRAPRATLIEVLRGGKQVLVLDRATGEYAVMKLGDSIQGFRIAAIEDDQMILVGPGKPERHFVIPLLDRTPVPPPKAPLATGDTELADPYATSKAPPATSAAPTTGAPAGEGVMDPYGPAEIPVVVAPEKSRAAAPDAIAGASAAASPSAPTSTPPAAPAPTPAPATAPAAALPPVPAAAPTTAGPAAPHSATAAPSDPKAGAARSEKRRLSRKELDRALSDSAALTREIKIERATGGGILVADLAKGSFAARAGIEKGDVVRRVAGHAIDTVDDAASAYAALLEAKQVVVELERRGARLHITYQLTN